MTSTTLEEAVEAGVKEYESKRRSKGKTVVVGQKYLNKLQVELENAIADPNLLNQDNLEIIKNKIAANLGKYYRRSRNPLRLGARTISTANAAKLANEITNDLNLGKQDLGSERASAVLSKLQTLKSQGKLFRQVLDEEKAANQAQQQSAVMQEVPERAIADAQVSMVREYVKRAAQETSRGADKALDRREDTGSLQETVKKFQRRATTGRSWVVRLADKAAQFLGGGRGRGEG
jgi:hypothetical protein